MFTRRTAIGLDVRARSIRAAALDTVTGEVLEAKLPGGNDADTTWITRIATEHGPVAVTYEAGPTRFDLARTLVDMDYPMTIAAPSKLLRPSGDKVKTDTRDALLLARLFKIDELVEVRVPTIAEESARDLVQAREDARVELMMCRQRLSKLLLRHNFGYDESVTWGTTHEAWLRRIRKNELTDAGQGTLVALDAAFDAATLGLARRDRHNKQISQITADFQFAAVTNRLCCLCDINTFTGFALAVEIGDCGRFTGRTIASYLDLVPFRVFLGHQQGPGRDHEAWEHPCPPAVRRASLASQSSVPARENHDRQVGEGFRSGRHAVMLELCA